MSLIQELARAGSFLISEAKGQLSRDQATLTAVNDGQTTWQAGTVLGQSTLAAPVGAAGGSNTGNGTISLVAATSKTKAGVYTAVCSSTSSNGAFTVYDPNGALLGTTADGTLFSSLQIAFKITHGGIAFVVSDSFTVTVSQGSMNMVALNPNAVDGSQNAAAVLFANQYMGGSSNVKAGVVTRFAEVASGLLIWPSGFNTTQTATATAQLAALGIVARASV